MQYIFAGDRDIATWVLEDLLEAGHIPSALMVACGAGATHAEELRKMVRGLAVEVIEGDGEQKENVIRNLKQYDPDWLISIHYPYLLPQKILEIPKHGSLNLHPAFLPYNRGWHTPSWAILDKTIIGATLHYMSEEVDAGDIVDQLEVPVENIDTADTLYRKVKLVERQLFVRNIAAIAAGTVSRRRQVGEGSLHKKADLFRREVQELDLDEYCRIEDLLRRLRALTTSKHEEAAYFLSNGKRIRVRVELDEA